MRLPRDVSGLRLSKRLELLGYVVTRQKGSHMRLTTTQNGEHHVTSPVHDPLRIGTLRSILADVASHFGLTRDQLVEQLFGTGL
ncbi:MAG: type II toxin-antitoxin system HicA family toxin [Fuerstia sp.]|nr:type II toxin-antitoxin system HicA family toxin [Fuerstiella sp.]